jgi:hypothetical protein
MERRTRDLAVALLAGLLLGATIDFSSRGVSTAARVSDRREQQEEATRKFLQVPDGEIHLRAVPGMAARLDERVGVYPGTRDTDDDALHEFFREDTRQWLVDLVEVAVGRKGTLTVELADRPTSDGTPHASLAQLVLEVEPGKPILFGMGVEGIGARAIVVPVWRTLLPDWAANEPVKGLDLSRLASVRVRLVGIGGRAKDASAPVATRAYTRGGVRSAWGSATTMEQPLSSEVRSSLDGLAFDWVPGGAHRFFGDLGHVVGTDGQYVTLGILFWSPLTDPRTVRSKESREFAEHVLGPVTVLESHERLSLTVEGKPTAPEASPYPLWVSRVRFEPAKQGGG